MSASNHAPGIQSPIDISFERTYRLHWLMDDIRARGYELVYRDGRLTVVQASRVDGIERAHPDNIVQLRPEVA